MRNLKNLPAAVKVQLGRIPTKFNNLGVGLGAMLVANGAFAQASGADQLQTAVSSELSAGKPIIYAVGGLVLGAIAAIVVIKLVRRSAG